MVGNMKHHELWGMYVRNKESYSKPYEEQIREEALASIEMMDNHLSKGLNLENMSLETLLDLLEDIEADDAGEEYETREYPEEVKEGAVLEKLQKVIKSCNTRSMPSICRRISTPNGLTYVQNRVIKMIAMDSSMSIDSALAQLESELNETA